MQRVQNRTDLLAFAAAYAQIGICDRIVEAFPVATRYYALGRASIHARETATAFCLVRDPYHFFISFLKYVYISCLSSLVQPM